MTTTSSSHLLRITLLSSVAALGGFLFGYDSGVINGTIGALREAFDTDAVGSGFKVASMLLGCAAGAFLADRFGRRAALFAAAILCGVSARGMLGRPHIHLWQ
jgi:SP family sugar:H+ symporter-like MFS transporter